MSQFHVDQIKTYIREQYELEHWKSDLQEVNNLSRLLALHALKLTLESADSDDLRIVEITDGAHDRGIDAVSVDSSLKIVTFVQSKWRQNGTGSMELHEILRFLDGVRALLGMRNENCLPNASESTRNAVLSLLTTPGAKLRLVTATTASESISEAVKEPVNELLDQLNDLEGTEPIATHVHLGQADFFNALTAPLRGKVDIETQIQDWGRVTEPNKAYYGRVNAAEVARWYSQHGAELFAENIRVVIPRSDINEGILRTIREDPEAFGYYNNGITILSEDIQVGAGGLLNRETGFFRLSRASIVNGAQTVSTLGSALGTDFETNLSRAFVLVRCVEVSPNNADLGSRITRFTNTQNEVSSQDFAFLDPTQHRLVRELQVLGYEYLLRSSESPRSANRMKVIDVRQAAVGLACASRNIAHSVVAKREVSRLFSEKSIYTALFNPNTEALRLLRSVLITRAIDVILDEIASGTTGVEAGLAIHGRRIIAHRLFRGLGDSFLADSSSDIDSALAALDQNVRGELQGMIAVFPDNAYPGNVFKNQARILDLVMSLDAANP
jgi:hypothetical protein